ncbi:hypothetical protein AB0933_32475 [Streptomyces venezuelae]|uniref:hypothetical protein n=1 Tax=Streptomyces venezuelae TaxID=54571 RepID=UPI003455A4FB
MKLTTADRRKLERQVAKEAAPAVKRMKSDLVKTLNGMSGEFAGQPVEVIKPVLQKRFAQATAGGSITDPELTEYAEEISRGGSFH